MHWLVFYICGSVQLLFWSFFDFIFKCVIMLYLFSLRVNFWGYSTVNYFSPMIRYSSAGIRNCGRDGVNEIKFLIKEAHKRGIEVTRITYDFMLSIVFWFLPFLFFIFNLDYIFIATLLEQVIMDVVFNHTAEGNENGPIISFRGVDNSVYYMVAPKVPQYLCSWIQTPMKRESN